MYDGPLLRAVRTAGSQSELARRLTEITGNTVYQAHVWNWINRSAGSVPGVYVIPIEQATGVSRHELRPDLYPVEDFDNLDGEGGQ